MTKKLYICGPMTGYAESNVPAFKAAKALVDALQGYEGVLPDDMENQQPATDAVWAVYMPKDVALVLTADGMVLLPEWTRSRGAKIEIACGLMQSLKYPNFEFRFYNNGKVSDCIDPSRIALAWYWDWDKYSKVAEAVQVA